MKKDKRLLLWERWLWEPEGRLFFVALLIIPSILLALLFYPWRGILGIVILVPLFVAAITWVVYHFVGSKVHTLYQSLKNMEGELFHSLIVNGLLHSPGLALLRENELVLVPIVGQKVTVLLSEIESFRTSSWFNGRLHLGKTAFWLNIPGRGRLGFAIARSVAAKWRERLSHKFHE